MSRDVKAEVLEAVRTSRAPVTAPELMERLKTTGPLVRAAVEALEREGRIAWVKTTARRTYGWGWAVVAGAEAA